MGQTPEAFRENLLSLEEAGFIPPPEEEWPPLYYELPYEAQEAIRLFYILPNKIDGMAGYTGKDLSVLSTYYDIFEVPLGSRKAVLQLLLIIINRSVETTAEKVKEMQNKKNKGK